MYSKKELQKCNLPQNRRPKQREIMAYSKYLNMKITEIKPKILALLVILQLNIFLKNML